MARRLAFTGLLLVACGGRAAPPAPPMAAIEPAPAVEPAPAPGPAAPVIADVDERPSRAVFAEGPSLDDELGDGPCKDYVDMTMRCIEQLAAAGQFPVDQLDQIRDALLRTLESRADASPEQRDAMDQACLAALEQQPPQWAKSGCTP